MAKSVASLNRLLSSMKKMSMDINDQEICKKLEILIATNKDEVNSISINQLLLDPLGSDASDIQEPFCQYARHFVYMIKRNNKHGVVYEPSVPKSAAKKSAKKAAKKN